MGLFYFHFDFDGAIASDEEGTELPDITAARLEAILTARELLADAIRSGKEQVPVAVVITDTSGQTLDEIRLKEVLPTSLK